MHAPLPRLLATLFALMLLAAQPARALNVKVHTFTLDNGMQVVVIPDHRAPVVTHMVWYRVGAADEPAGKTGLTHYLEHLLFKGTKKIKPGEFSKIVKRHGGNDNAFTSRDYTAYFQRIAKEHLPLVMELEADRIANLQLSEKDVKTELEVIKEERRMRTENDPRALFSERLYAALFTAHPYRRPVVGWMADVEHLTLADVMAHYRRFYTPANAIVVVAGDVTPEEVKKLAEKYYAPLKNTAPKTIRWRTPEPPPLTERRLTMRDPRVRQPTFQRLYVAPAYRTAKGKEAHALDVLAEALGGGTTSVLYRKLVVQEQVAAFAGAFYSGNDRDYGTFGIYAVPAPGTSPEKLEARIDATLREVLANGINEKRLTRTKNAMIASAIYALDSQFALARIFGSALTADSTIDSVLQWDERIATVSGEDMLAAARKVLKPANSVSGWLLPAPRKTASAAQATPAKAMPAARAPAKATSGEERKQ